MMINEFKGLQFNCPPTTTSGCYANGQEFLDTYDLETVRILFLPPLILIIIFGVAWLSVSYTLIT
jgi:hypothetical protein